MDLNLTGHTCACGATIVSSYSWRNLDPAVRDQATAAGYARAGTVTECHRCACRKAPRRNPQARRRTYAPGEEPYTAEEVLTEWRHLRDVSLSISENCERLAPRMGLKPKTLETALYRAGIRDNNRDAA